MPSIKCSRFHSQETEDSIDGNDSPGGGAELCPPDFVFVALTRRKTGDALKFWKKKLVMSCDAADFTVHILDRIDS